MFSQQKEEIESPITSRPFLMGFSSDDSGFDKTLQGDQDLIDKLSASADIVSLFFHVQWNKLQKRLLLEGHERELRIAEMAREKGLKFLLIFDFTHDGLDTSRRDLGVGRINKFLDGSPLPPGGLDNPEIREAYKAELLAVVKRIRPEYVRVGIEINLFYQTYPKMWPAFAKMYSECYDEIKAQFPAIEVSVYDEIEAQLPTAEVSVHTDGLPRELLERVNNKQMSKALRVLLPKLDSLGYSFYYDKPWEKPKEHFTKILEISPQLPLFIPEFGIRGADTKEDLRKQLKGLSFLFEVFASVNTKAVVWYSLYDQDYTGTPDWFSSAFTTIGMIQRDGSPKPAYELWKQVLGLPLRSVPVDK